MKQIKISATIITKNEAKNIVRCLTSLVGVADEIVVVDSFSIDETKALCAQFDVQFFQHPFQGHIQQKNKAVELATHNYILSLDADEALSAALQSSILAVKQNWEATAYSMNRLNNYCGQWIRHAGWYPDRKTRLFDRRFAKWGGVNPHDRVLVDETQSKQHLKGDLLHYSYDSISDHIQRMDRYTDIMAAEAFKQRKRATLFKIVISPLFNFFKKYILKLGFLDGYYGFIVCVMAGYYNFLKYAKLREIQKQQE